MNILAVLKSISRHCDKVHGKPEIIYDPVEKSIGRHAKKEVRRSFKAKMDLLTECGGGRAPFRYSNAPMLDDCLAS